MSQVKDIGVATNNGFAKIKEMYYKKDADTFEKLVLPEVERVDANPFIVDVPFPVKENEKFTVGVEATTTKGDISYITWELESVNDNATDGLGLLVPKDYDGKATEDVVYIMQPDNKTTIFTEPGTITAIDTLSNIGQVKDSVPLMTATEYGIAKPDGTTCIINDDGELVCIDTVGNVDPVQPTITDQMVIDRITDQMVIDRITEEMARDKIKEIEQQQQGQQQEQQGDLVIYRSPDKNIIYDSYVVSEDLTDKSTYLDQYSIEYGTIIKVKVIAKANVNGQDVNVIPAALYYKINEDNNFSISGYVPFDYDGIATLDTSKLQNNNNYFFYLLNGEGVEKADRKTLTQKDIDGGKIVFYTRNLRANFYLRDKI